MLNELGFTRVSYGVQDYNLEVQLAIQRFQPFKNVKDATENARKAGYTSVGRDIIFGLPFQTVEHIRTTIAKTKELMPDRIAMDWPMNSPQVKQQQVLQSCPKCQSLIYLPPGPPRIMRILN